MAQRQSPFLEAAYGWNFGEGGWNTGMDSNLLKFSFMFDRNIDSITAALPAAVNGQAHYLTTDNRLYFAVNTTYFSTPVPKWFIIVVRTTGDTWQFNGTTLSQLPSFESLGSRLDAAELTVESLGTAAFEDVGFFATQAQLDIVEAQSQSYTDDLRQDLSSDTGAGMIGYKSSLADSIARTASASLDDSVFAESFGAIGDGVTDNTVAVQNAQATGRKVRFRSGIFLMNVVVQTYFDWEGEGATKTIFKPFNVALPAMRNMFLEPDWRFPSLSNIGFESTGVRQGVGFSYGDPAGYTNNQEYIGRVRMVGVSFKSFDKGVFKCYGNIGNTYDRCSFQFNNYGHYARGAAVTVTVPQADAMQSTNDTFSDCEMHENEKAALIYIDTVLPFGAVSLNNCTLQFNKGFGLFVSAPQSANAVHAFLYNNVWDEANGTAYPGQGAHTVSIDTITGVQVLSPKGVHFEGDAVRGFISLGATGSTSTFGTTNNAGGKVSVWGDGRTAVNLISGGASAQNWTQLAFCTEGAEATPGAYIRGTKRTGNNSDIQFYTGSGAAIPLTLTESGSMSVGTFAAQYANPAPGTHLIWGDSNVAGNLQLLVGGRFAFPTQFKLADATGENAALSVLSMGKVASTNRSINAAGTINASGADYAEYEQNNGLVIAKGDIVGFKVDGTLTNKFSEAFRFGIKSTNPAIVGGDTWGGEDCIGKKPEEPKSPDGLNNSVAYKREYKAYEKELVDFEKKLAVARAQVDRIAYCGKVPVNVLGAVPGAYIVPVEGPDGCIVGEPLLTPNFDQYRIAVGRVNKLLEDGRCEVAVMVH